MRWGWGFDPGTIRRIRIDCDPIADGFVIGRHDRRQMPVGQGGFHVGALATIDSQRPGIVGSKGLSRFREADFLYVYDCGSEPKKQVVREIGRFAKERTRRKLDMLFLSHFDRDHICGTPDLLSKTKGFQVDTILLPFVDDAERIIAFARTAAASATGNGAISRFFREMIVDPVGTLQGFDPRQIIQVAAGDGGPPIEGSPTDPPRHDDPDSPTAWKLTGSGMEARHRPTVFSPPNGGAAAGRANVVVARDPSIHIHSRSGAFEWLLKPWVKPADPAAVALFCAEAERELRWVAGSFRIRMANPDDRRYVVTRGRTKLARAYRTAFIDKNLTSMSLYSGPLQPEALHALPLDPLLQRHPETKIGWMGTGDAHLKTDAEIDEFERFYQDELDFVSSFAFPHHGSIKNSNPDRLVSNADHWVASADPIHDWLHPHPSLQAAAVEKGRMRWVRSTERSAFDEAVLFARREDIVYSRCCIWVGR